MAKDDELTRLARGAAAGDADALAELVRGTQADVWRLVAHLAGASLADDLTQETYLRALRSLPGFRRRSSVRVWLLAIARRVVAAHFADDAREQRRRQRAAAHFADVPRGDPAETLALRSLLDSLAPEQREAFVLTQLLGLTYHEAAAVCGCPTGTIRSRVARARHQLIAGYRGTPADVRDKNARRRNR